MRCFRRSADDGGEYRGTRRQRHDGSKPRPGLARTALDMVWAVPCGAIWGVVPVVSGMFFSPVETLLICLGIFVYMGVMMRIVSKVFGRRLSPKETRSGMIMELPPYHKVHWKHIIKEAFLKAFDIFKRALGTVTISYRGAVYVTGAN